MASEIHFQGRKQFLHVVTILLWLHMMTSWHDGMEMFSALLALCGWNPPATSGFPHKVPLMWSFDIFFVVILDKLLNKQLSCWWFETLLMWSL